MRRLAVVLVVLAAGLAAPAAFADTPTIPATAPTPGTDAGHGTPLEVLASRIASHIAGRTVSVRCWEELYWDALADAGEFDPDRVLGFVLTRSDPETGLFAETATDAELSPAVCEALQTFAQASVKPTKCRPTVVSYVPTRVKQVVTRYRLVHRHGKTTKVPYRVTVTKTVTKRVESPGPPTPCFSGGQPTAENRVCNDDGVCYSAATTDVAGDYWRDYSGYATAILALAHEPIHLWQAQAGAAVPPDSLVETQAECYGLQWMPWVATELGATADDAQSIADFTWKLLYPMRAGSDDPALPYWSAGCAPGGELDIRPAGATAWP
ncbi:MAG TPA: hypothetical protein VFJ91_08235 [Gaiellaceae bacterium]|nr:hypothetical protein [Gaiellaceae bacterium]